MKNAYVSSTNGFFSVRPASAPRPEGTTRSPCTISTDTRIPNCAGSHADDLDRPDHEEDVGQSLAEPDRSSRRSAAAAARGARRADARARGPAARSRLAAPAGAAPRDRPKSIAIERTIETTKPMRIPCAMPNRSSSRPPSGGASTIGKSLQDRLDREADDPAAALELLADEGEGRGKPERRPRHHEEESDEDAGDGAPGPEDREARDGQRAEEQQRAPRARGDPRATRPGTHRPRRGSP